MKTNSGVQLAAQRLRPPSSQLVQTKEKIFSILRRGGLYCRTSNPVPPNPVHGGAAFIAAHPTPSHPTPSTEGRPLLPHIQPRPTQPRPRRGGLYCRTSNPVPPNLVHGGAASNPVPPNLVHGGAAFIAAHPTPSHPTSSTEGRPLLPHIQPRPTQPRPRRGGLYCRTSNPVPPNPVHGGAAFIAAHPTPSHPTPAKRSFGHKKGLLRPKVRRQ